MTNLVLAVVSVGLLQAVAPAAMACVTLPGEIKKAEEPSPAVLHQKQLTRLHLDATFLEFASHNKK